MRLAIPLFGDDVSPRFCFAREMLVVELENRQAIAQQVISLGDTAWPERLTILLAQRVEVLLCGGFPRRYLPVANSAGIRVVVGLRGTAAQVLEAYCGDNLDDVLVAPCLQEQTCSSRSRDPNN